MDRTLALVLEEVGDPPRLALEEVPLPPLGSRQVRVRVEACGVCFHDVLVMRGVLRRGVKPRLVLGHEIAGVVEAVGPDVRTLQPGQGVVALLTEPCGACMRCRSGREHRCERGVGIGHGRDGGFARHLVVSESALVPLPPEADLRTACLYACPMGVALHALRDAVGLRAGETALIVGAGGGLGVHALQVARALGARALAVTTSPWKEGGLRSLGADEVLVAEDMDFGDLARALTEDRGAEVVFNAVGARAFPACWQALAQFGRMALVGEVEGGEVRLNPAELLFRDAGLYGVSGVSARQVEDIARLVAWGRLRPVVDTFLPLSPESALTAFRRMRRREALGRLVLLPWEG